MSYQKGLKSIASWRRCRRFAAALGLALLAGCYPISAGGSNGQGTPAPFTTGTVLADANQVAATTGMRSADLLGDPQFSAETLSGDARDWYEELWSSIEHPEQREFIEALAQSDNLYEYSRLVNTYITSLLTALRVSGDLRFLDEVDRLTQMMREQLDDSWRGIADRSEGRDGYLNWVWRNDTSSTHRGKDLHETDEMGAHALVAEIAFAFHSNRESPSPAGVDYAERADFWQDYLKEHFEAKWRERKGIAWPRFPFLSRPHMHETVSFIRYHYYMYRLTGEDPYLQEALRLSDLVYGEFREAETEVGPAFVWPRSVISAGGSERYLMPTTYSSLIISDALDLYWEGFYGWAQADVPIRLARTVSQFIIDSGAESFARDVGGGESRAGLPASSERDWSRMGPAEYAIKPIALLAAWDETGEIARVSRQVYEDLPDRHRYLHIPLGLFIDALDGPAEPDDEANAG